MTDDCDETRAPRESRWERYDLLDPLCQLYDVADCDSWRVPGRRSTGPCDLWWKGDYDRAAAFRCMYRNAADCDGDIDPGPRADIDARIVPTRPLWVTGTVPGAMVWDLTGADGDCEGAA